MKIIDTFVPCLYAFKYPENDIDELERVFDDWSDTEFLFDFFEDNKSDIKISIEEAIEKVIDEANFLREKLLKLANSKPNQLNQLFKNLSNFEYTDQDLSKQKARNRWLRLYAIKIDMNNYVITGGTIKLTQLMQDRPHTYKELIKINRCRDYLKEMGIYDADSFHEIIF